MMFIQRRIDVYSTPWLKYSVALSRCNVISFYNVVLRRYNLLTLYNIILTSMEHHDVYATTVPRHCVDAWLCINVKATLYKRHEPAGLQVLYLLKYCFYAQL